MLLNYFCPHLPLHFTTTHCLSLPLQRVSDNGTSIINVIELLLSSSSSPLHYHTLSISTIAESKWQWHINNECHWTTFVFIFLSTSLLHIVYLYHCRWVSENGTSIMNVIELFLSSSSSPLHNHTLSISTNSASKWQWHINNECHWTTFVFIFLSPLHYHTLSISTNSASKWQWHINNECHWNTFVFIFFSTSLPHIVYLYHCSQ